MELSEEARLTGGQWIPLLPDSHPGIYELKWGTNTFSVYLCLDPVPDATPAPRDQEEFIEIREGVGIDELKRLVCQGQVMMPSVQAAFMAIEYLQGNQLL